MYVPSDNIAALFIELLPCVICNMPYLGRYGESVHKHKYDSRNVNTALSVSSSFSNTLAHAFCGVQFSYTLTG